MRRLATLVCLLCFTIPFGVSLSGCSKNSPATFCNGQNNGVIVGQTTTLNLEPRLTGISLNAGAISRVPAPSAKDCKGTASTVGHIVFGSTNLNLVDISPADGRICAGTWNRNTGGGVPDFTTCTPTTQQGTAFVTASADGVTSNPLSVYVHPIVTSVLLGPASTDCIHDPASNCALDAAQPNGCSVAAPSAVTSYDGNSCISQGMTAQLAARSFKGTDPLASTNNISCLVGPLTFTPATAAIVTIDQSGVATARQPGSSTINANISQSSSSAGFFSTCPPRSIVLSVPGQTTPPTAPIVVSQNIPQTLIATVVDTLGAPLTNVQLEYVSTTPVTVPASSNVITPTFPGAAAITAVCQPPRCNSSPFNQIGLFGNGTPITSNPVNLNATGTGNSTVLYIASTSSQYLLPIDFTLSTQSAPVRLRYVPNSMVISEDLSTIYLGTANELIIYNTGSNSTIEDISVQGNVLAVSPDNSTVVVTDPVRKLTYLYLAKSPTGTGGATTGSTGGISTEQGGVGTRAQWSPDSQTVYITTADNRLLVYSTFTGWSSVPLANLATDVAVTVPNAGVYLGGTPVTARTNCPVTTLQGTGVAQTTTNTFYPQTDLSLVATADRLAATNDGVHILGATPTTFTDIQTNQKSGVCPVAFTSTASAPLNFTGIAASSISNILPTTDSAFALVTYQGTGGVVPQYTQSTVPATPGTLSNVPLQTTAGGAPVAPVSGVISSDNQTIYVGTTGDNLVHRLTRGPAGFSDTIAPIAPQLPGFNGGTATPDLLVQRPRKSIS